MDFKCVLTGVRYLDCPCYWLEGDESLAWEDRDVLVILPLPASQAFRSLIRSGWHAALVTNADLARVMEAQLAPAVGGAA
jgi:hypothetical protein